MFKTRYLIGNSVSMMGTISPVSEPGQPGELTVEVFLSPAEQVEVLLVKK